MIMNSKSVELKKTALIVILPYIGLALLLSNILYYIYNRFN